jgi:hypothetical protein
VETVRAGVPSSVKGRVGFAGAWGVRPALSPSHLCIRVREHQYQERERGKNDAAQESRSRRRCGVACSAAGSGSSVTILGTSWVTQKRSVLSPGQLGG